MERAGQKIKQNNMFKTSKIEQNKLDLICK